MKHALPAALALATLAGLAACAGEMEDTPAARAPAATPDAGATTTAAAPGDLAGVRDRLGKLLPEIKQEDITSSVAAGLFQVKQGSYYAYVTGDGRYLITGDMVNLETGEEVTENQRKGERLAKLEAFGAENMIEFAPAKPVQTRYTVTVFTDVDCGYCRKLHSEIADFNKQGIAIRYVFFPRSGPQSEAFSKAESIWCAKDRKSALTLAKMGAPVTPAQCENPIQREYELGQEFGLRGTPMMVLPNGEVVNGYVPAPQLAQRLAALQTGTVPAAETAVQ